MKFYMYLLIAFLAPVFSAAYAGSLQDPTVTQVDPDLATNCTAASFSAPTDTVIQVTGSSGGYTMGTASFSGFRCYLKVHSGRGGGIRVFSGCAEVLWDASGTIVMVTPGACD